MKQREIKLVIEKNPEDYDHDNVRFNVDGEIKGFGFIARKPDDQTVALMKCPLCGKENYAMSVASGQCAWCEFSTKDLLTI